MLDFNPALIQLWLSWLFLFSVISGIGLFVYAFFGLPRLERRELLLSFWVGLAVATFFLQIWHLFLPVNALADLVLCIVGGVGLWRCRRDVWRVIRAVPRYWGVIAVLLGMSVWIASRAASAEVFTDDAIYHIQDILWTTSYAIVPGLSNLHGRFGFNNAYTLSLSAIEATPFLATAIRLGNSLLLLAFIGRALVGIRQMLSERAFLPQEALLALGIVPLLVRLNYASSIKNDLIVSLLSLLLGALLLDVFLQPPPSRRERYLRILIAALIACFGVTVKLSFGVYGMLVLAVLLVVLLRGEPQRAHQVRQVLLVGVVFVCSLGIWVLRGIILSGYPVYPMTVAPMPVPWRVPEAMTQDEADLIYAWARHAWQSIDTTLASWDWVSGWFDAFWRNIFDAILPTLLFISGLLVLAWSVLRRQRRAELPLWQQGLFAVPALAAVLFWFFTAPDIRFGWQYLWLLGGGTFAMALWHARQMALLRAVVVGLVIILTFEVILRSDLTGPYGQVRFMPFPEDGQLAPIEAPQHLYRYTSYHGVDMWVAEDEYCLGIDLPCARVEMPYLKLREPGNLGAGFVTEEVESDKGAFALRALNPADDIGPDAASAALHAGTLATDGLLVGNGWQALETAGDEQYRWVDNDAEIYVTAPTGAQTQLALDIEPGPSLGDGEHVVQLVDENDDVVAEAPLTGRGVITFELPLTDERVQIFRLRVDSDDVPAPNDGRILNIRVIGFDWAS